eukprot:5283041-Pleurochrysis_carterae.AAC.1
MRGESAICIPYCPQTSRDRRNLKHRAAGQVARKGEEKRKGATRARGRDGPLSVGRTEPCGRASQESMCAFGTWGARACVWLGARLCRGALVGV